MELVEKRIIKVELRDGSVVELPAEVTHTIRGVARFNHPEKKTRYGSIQAFVDSRYKGLWHSIIPTKKDYNIKVQVKNGFKVITVTATRPKEACEIVQSMGYPLIVGVYNIDGELIY